MPETTPVSLKPNYHVGDAMIALGRSVSSMVRQDRLEALEQAKDHIDNEITRLHSQEGIAAELDGAGLPSQIDADNVMSQLKLLNMDMVQLRRLYHYERDAHMYFMKEPLKEPS